MISVNVPENLKGSITLFSYGPFLDILKFQTEYYNTGSIAYKARIRIDVFNDSQMVFTGWSDEKSMMPGDRKNFEIYWYTNSTGNFTAKARVYFANEINEEELNIEKKVSTFPESIFEIESFRTYDNHVIFDLMAKKDARNVVVIPSNFPLGWIFEQKKIDSINKDEGMTVILHYYPSVWTPQNINLVIASDEGRYSTEKTVELRKETGIQWLFYYIVDGLRSYFSS